MREKKTQYEFQVEFTQQFDTMEDFWEWNRIGNLTLCTDNGCEECKAKLARDREGAA